MKTLEDLIGGEEGLRLFLYSDSVGVPTIGYGRNLRDVGISPDEAELMRKNDCARVRAEADSFWWFKALDPVRQLVVQSMLFNLGLTRFLGFKRMIEAMKNKDYHQAAVEMRSSVWAAQVKERAETLAQWMETGCCPS